MQQRPALERRKRLSNPESITSSPSFSPNRTTKVNNNNAMARQISSISEQGDEIPLIDVYTTADEEKATLLETRDDNDNKKAIFAGNGEASNNNLMDCWTWFPALPGARSLRRPHSFEVLNNDDYDDDDDEKKQESVTLSSMAVEMGPMMVDLTPSSRNSSSSFLVDEEEAAAVGDLVEEEVAVTEPPKPPLTDEKPETKQRRRPLRRLRESFREKSKPLNIEEYASGREMTKTQERWNAITMVPPSIYCLYYLFTSTWVNSDLVDQAHHDYAADPAHFAPNASTGFAGTLNTWVSGTESGCMKHDSVFSLFWVALPPLTIWAVVLGTCLHCPFSFLYHWKYSHELRPSERVQHWSRRMDHAMIHFAAAMYSYASSGSLDYFLACALFNLDSARRHFLPHFRPRSNQVRVGIAILAYSLPIWRRGDVTRFCLFWAIVGFSMYLFSQYPIGGWSHAAFHLGIGLLVPLLLDIAAELPASQAQLKLAAQCTVLLQQQQQQ